jgi:antitoxin ParD1/3/4
MIVRITRNVSLTPELARFVAAQIATGRYSTASEVVRASLRLLEEEERRRSTAPLPKDQNRP